MQHQVYIAALAFQPVNEKGQPDGPEEIVKRGGMVPDYATTFLISALSNAGMIVPVGDRPDPRIRPLAAEPAPTLNPENPPPPEGVAGVPVSGDPVTPVAKPKATDNKAAWEDYAASHGMDRGEAETATKGDLIARFKDDQ